MEIPLSVPEYLIALRHARSFTKEAIQEEVVKVALKKNALPTTEKRLSHTIDRCWRIWDMCLPGTMRDFL